MVPWGTPMRTFGSDQNYHIHDPDWILSEIEIRPEIAHQIREPLINDEEFVLQLLRKFNKHNIYPDSRARHRSGTDFSWLPAQFRQKKDFMIQAIEILPGLVESVPDYFWQDERFARAAAEADAASCCFRGPHADITLPQSEASPSEFVCYSVRYFYRKEAKPHTLRFLHLLACVKGSGYNPNDYNKGFCGSPLGVKGFLTDPAWPCRGNCFQLGQLNFYLGPWPFLQSKCDHRTCWRRSFRQKLEKAKSQDGFLLQVVETEPGERNFVLGAGQHIEALMAKALGVKILRVFLAEPTVTFHGVGGGGQKVQDVVADVLEKIETLKKAPPGTECFVSLVWQHFKFEPFSDDDMSEMGAKSWCMRSWILGQRLWRRFFQAMRPAILFQRLVPQETHKVP